jgi:hypothetical protein
MFATASASMCATMVSTGTRETVNASLSIATVLSDIISTLHQIIANVFNSHAQMDIRGTQKNAPANANIKKIAVNLMELAMKMLITILINPPAVAVALTSFHQQDSTGTWTSAPRSF